MSGSPASRTYRSELRTSRARETRRRILAAASTTFLSHGYAGTTMRTIAGAAGVSVPTLEAAFGTKPALLKAAIDVSIAGDDEPVGVLERDWVAPALDDPRPGGFLRAVAEVVLATQRRSAGLILAALEGARSTPELGDFADQLIRQRATTARWIVDGLRRTAELRPGWTPASAADLVWTLMDPAVYVRLVADRGWTPEGFRDWWTRSVQLLMDDPAPRTGGANREENE